MEVPSEHTYKKWIECGKELGYVGKELDEWVEKKWKEVVAIREKKMRRRGQKMKKQELLQRKWHRENLS